jgi:hypothetical protein
MQRFLALARQEQCILMEVGSGVVLLPVDKVVAERVLGSRAMQFVRDPAGTIFKAAQELKDNGR